jgi:Fic family protein
MGGGIGIKCEFNQRAVSYNDFDKGHQKHYSTKWYILTIRVNIIKFDRTEPYNDLPLLFPEEKYWRTLDVLEASIKANRALAELKGRMASIPNPKIFLNTLTLQEAKDSSAIENVFTTNDKLFKAFTSSSIQDPQTKEVLLYGKALVEASGLIKDNPVFTIDNIEQIYQSIKSESDGIREGGVRIGNSFTTVYTPPSGKKLILEKIDNWLTFANSHHNIEPLIKMAVLHYQFEAIHPFRDGNGRTGRLLNVLFLSMHGLLDEPILCLSRYINEYRGEYYNLLQSVTEKYDWEKWILYILAAVENTAEYTQNKVRAILDLMDETKRKMVNEVPDVYSHELLELLFTQVYSKYAFVEERGIASRNTASKYLNKLSDIGILEKEKIGNEYIFKNTALYNVFIDV